MDSVGSNFWWIYDIVTVLIIAFGIIRFAKKGFSKVLVTAIGCAVSLIAAFVLSKSTSGFIYDNFFMKSNTEAVEKSMKEFIPEDVIKNIIEESDLPGIMENGEIRKQLESRDILGGLYGYVNKKASAQIMPEEQFDDLIVNGFSRAFAAQMGSNLPPYVVEEITEKYDNNEGLFVETMEMIINRPGDIPEYIEKNYIKDIAKKIISSAVFLVVFFVLITIVILVSGRAEKFGLLNGYDRLDRFAGGVLGIIAAVAAVMIIAMAIKLMINITDKENSFVSLNTVENTILFRHFYNFL